MSLPLIFTSYSIKLFLDNYSYPNFTKIEKSINHGYDFIHHVKILDIAGASICSDQNFFKDINKKYTLDQMKKDYVPKHENLSEKLFKAVNSDYKTINTIWLDVAKNHPICFFKNKYEILRFSIGANEGSQFLITDPELNTEEKDFGYRLYPSNLRSALVSYITGFDKIGYLKPWIIYILALLAYFKMYSKNLHKKEDLILGTSSLLYFFSQVMIGNAADARLLFYSNTVMIIILFVSLYRITDGFKKSFFRSICN
jgi:hypothetical protein